MRFSVWPTWMQGWAGVAETVSHAEHTGWDGAWIADHFMGDGGEFGPADAPTIEATAALAALAASTERLRIGSLALAMSHRHPAAVANWAATVDHISNGRLVLGIGAGWQPNEHRQYGFDLLGVGERVDRFDECCAALVGLLNDPVTTFPGRWIHLEAARCEPKPLQAHLPLLVAGKGSRMLLRVARYADEWNMWGLPDVLAERASELSRQCEVVARDPSSIRRSTQAHVLITDDPARAKAFVAGASPRAAIAGSADQIIDAVAAWQAAGIDEVIVPDLLIGTGAAATEFYDAFIEQVAPNFR